MRDPVALQDVHQVLGGDVAGRAGRERATADAADRAVEDRCAVLQRSDRARHRRVPGVVEMDADRWPRTRQGAHQATDVPW